MTLREIPSDIAEALDVERRRRDTSLEQTVLDLLRRSLLLEHGRRPTNGLERFAGPWSAADLREFEDATKHFERVDEDDWR